MYQPAVPEEVLALYREDAKFREKVNEFLGRDPHPSGGGREVLHLSAPSLGFNFEWHPQARRLYFIRDQGSDKSPIGEVVAFHVETHGDAVNVLNCFIRGYQEGRDSGPKPHLQL